MTHAEEPVRLEHAFLYVRDLDAALAFYRRVLPGWTVRWEGRARAGRWVHFGPPGGVQPSYLSICEAPAAAAPPEEDRAPGVDHIGFAHPDVDGLVARLAAAGIAPTDELEEGPWRRAYFRDPDGHQLEFVQHLG